MLKMKLALGTACLAFVSSSIADEELTHARALWAAAAPSAYEYGYNKFCECHRDAPPETLVTVVDDTVTNVRHVRTDSSRVVPAAEKNFAYYWTIRDLFALVESAQESSAFVTVSFDARFGYPLSVYIDYDGDRIGDELDVRVTRFTALER